MSLLTTLFNLTADLEDHEGTISIGGRTITNLHFADDIDGLAGEEEKLVKLVERLDKASTTHGILISAKKTTLMTKKNPQIASTHKSKLMDRSVRQS